MPITAVTIENFKSIGEPVRIELKPITMLFGPNSVGKSTIIQALHYAREIFEHGNVDPGRSSMGGELIDLGGFLNFINKHDLNKQINIRFDVKDEEIPYKYEHITIAQDGANTEMKNIENAIYRIESFWIEISIKHDAINDVVFITKYEIGINNDLFIIISQNDCNESKEAKIIYFNKYHNIFLLDDKEVNDIIFNNYNQLSKKMVNENIDINKLFEVVKDACAKSSSIFNNETQNDILNDFIEDCYMWRGIKIDTDSPIDIFYSHSALPVNEEELYFDGLFVDKSLNRWDIELINSGLTSLITGPCKIVKKLLNDLIYIGPFRNVPDRSFIPFRSSDESNWANGTEAWDVLYKSDPSIVKQVNEWLSERFESDYEVVVKRYKEFDLDGPSNASLQKDQLSTVGYALKNEIKPLPEKRRLFIRDYKQGVELEPKDMGVGISQVLPVIVAAIHAEKGFVAIEQPELHIHPALQVALGDLFVKESKRKQGLCFILETHSEHLLLRILRRIRETGEGGAPEGFNLNPEDISINFLEKGENGLVLTPIRVDKDGDFLDRWPRGFFHERAEELF